MKLQAIISDASHKKIVSYKAAMELKTGNRMNMDEAVDAFIQNAKIDMEE